MSLNGPLTIQALYDELGKLVSENKGNCPVGLFLDSGCSSMENDLEFSGLDINSFSFDADTFWVTARINDGRAVVVKPKYKSLKYS